MQGSSNTHTRRLLPAMPRRHGALFSTCIVCQVGVDVGQVGGSGRLVVLGAEARQPLLAGQAGEQGDAYTLTLCFYMRQCSMLG